MRMLYYGTLDWGSTSLQRSECLRRIATEFYAVDNRQVLPEYHNRPILTRIRMRVGSRTLVRRYGALLVRETERFRPDCVWVDQGILLSGAAVRRTKAAGSRVAVHFSPDAVDAPGTGLVHHRAIPSYDLCITTKHRDVDRLQALGSQQTHFSYQGFDSRIHRPVLPPVPGAADDVCDIVFIGQRMREREEFLTHLARELPEVDVRVYGRGWDSVRRGPLDRCIRNRWLRGDDYASALSNARIGLCFLNTEVQDDYTTRTFEIPACGSFLLAQRSPTHEELFLENEEAAFFSSMEDLVIQSRRWLANEAARMKAAKAAHHKVIENDWSWEARMRGCVKEVETLLRSSAHQPAGSNPSHSSPAGTLDQGL